MIRNRARILALGYFAVVGLAAAGCGAPIPGGGPPRPLSIPGTVSGTLESPSDVDNYTFFAPGPIDITCTAEDSATVGYFITTGLASGGCSGFLQTDVGTAAGHLYEIQVHSESLTADSDYTLTITPAG